MDGGNWQVMCPLQKLTWSSWMSANYEMTPTAECQLQAAQVAANSKRLAERPQWPTLGPRCSNQTELVEDDVHAIMYWNLMESTYAEQNYVLIQVLRSSCDEYNMSKEYQRISISIHLLNVPDHSYNLLFHHLPRLNLYKLYQIHLLYL